MILLQKRIINNTIFNKISQNNFGETQGSFLELINNNNIEHVENLARKSDWLIYVYHCYLVEMFVENKHCKIIDWGGLFGHVTAILKNMEYKHVTNYLFHKDSKYQLFENKFNLKTIHGHEPNKLNLDSSSVDAFISSGVLEHVREDGQGCEEIILKEINRVLKPGGYLFIWNLPAKLSISEIIAKLLLKDRHKHKYNKRTVVKLLIDAGYEISYFDKHRFLPGQLIDLLSTKIDILKIMKFDYKLSHILPFSILANHFTIIAKKKI